MTRRFMDDEPIQCDVCNDLIYAGSKYQKIIFKGKAYRCCNYEDCMKSLLFRFFEDEFEEYQLYTKEELAEMYADLEGD